MKRNYDKSSHSNVKDTKKLHSDNINPFTGKPYSDRYYNLMKVRKTLPVYEYFPEIEKAVDTYQTIIIEGETGSGKTTQIPQVILFPILDATSTWLS